MKEPCGRADRPPPDRRGLVHPSEPCRARAARRRAHRARAAAAPASTRGPECTARRAPHLAASAARQLRTKPGAPRPPPRASPSCSRAWPAARRPARPRLSPRAARGAATFPATASTFGGDQEGAFVGGEPHRLAPDINDARRASRSGEGSEDASTRASPVDPRRSLAWEKLTPSSKLTLSRRPVGLGSPSRRTPESASLEFERRMLRAGDEFPRGGVSPAPCLPACGERLRGEAAADPLHAPRLASGHAQRPGGHSSEGVEAGRGKAGRNEVGWGGTTMEHMFLLCLGKRARMASTMHPGIIWVHLL